ncbi:hypothetical protein KFL_003250120 [Klebsormidium nitens]|uniref:Uncharacterized protein n=1 Tax=Klebsormidium nitens TaxID=105231 RepID=A0A1Y1IC57_KLENI|nr:hypothetical protein KFL_003250120 [Klebsormidium nitens]|eukprot:GAQ87009.1 hypothetical protein KFL_003250120 [Klebsormidium nitens]
MTTSQRMRLRALGLQDDPLYWTRPVPISELTAPRSLRWQHASTGSNGLRAAAEVVEQDSARADVSHLPRLQTPVSTALELLINSLCVEEGWETSSPETSPTWQNGGTSGRSSPYQVAENAGSQGAIRNRTGRTPSDRRSKPARVRFQEDGEEREDVPPEGSGGKLENGQTEQAHATGEDGSEVGRATESSDEFENLALRFHKQPVKVTGKESGLDPTQKGTPHPSQKQGYQYTPHPVKGIRKSVQPGTPFPLGNGLPSRSPFERKQNLQPITEVDYGSSSSPATLRPARDGSLGASSSGGSLGATARKRSGLSSTGGTSELLIMEGNEQNDQTSPLGPGSSQEPTTQMGRSRETGNTGKLDTLRTTQSLDGQKMLPRGLSPERSAESVLVKRSPYLAPVRNVRTAGGDSGLGTQRRDRLAQFAEYLASQKGSAEEMRASGEGDSNGANSPVKRAAPPEIPTECDSPSGRQEQLSTGEGSQRRYERSWIQTASPGRSPTKRLVENGCATTRPQRWVIGESRTNRQRGSALPELKRQRSNGTRASEGPESPTQAVPTEETSWSKAEKQRRRRRLSKEQAWLNKSHQRMALWMQDHFAALERIAHLTPSERADAERMWSAAQAAARDRKLNLIRLHSTIMTGLEKDEKGAETGGGRSEATEERPLCSPKQTTGLEFAASDSGGTKIGVE